MRLTYTFGIWATPLVLFGVSGCTTVPAKEAGTPRHTGPSLVSESQSADDPFFLAGVRALEDARRHGQTGYARNVILFVGDGMSLDTVTAARILEGQRRGNPGEEGRLNFETLPHLALAKTYNTNQQTPDSAGTATAMLTGVKTKAGVIGVSSSTVRGDCASGQQHAVPSLLEMSEAAGLATGVISTARLTHATPASAYAHVAERGWESDADQPPEHRDCKDIARQFVEFQHGDGIEVAFGGGRSRFLPATMPDPEDAGATGERLDGRDLTAEWLARFGDDAAYVWNRSQFEALARDAPNHVLGLFERDHLEFEADRATDTAGEPSLSAMTATAIRMLQRDPDGFFLFVEGGRIDHAHHLGNAARALDETIAMADAVRTARAMTSPDDTLIIVTADHGHVMSFGGYPTRGNPILGKVIGNGPDGEPAADYARDTNGLPYTTLSYANGPGHRGDGPRPDLTSVDTSALDFLQEATVPSDYETHSGVDVPVYSGGPGAALLNGVVEQNFLFHVMHHALRLPGL